MANGDTNLDKKGVDMFKIGDKVERVSCEWQGMRVGDVDEVTNVGKDDIYLRIYGEGHEPSSFKLVETKDSIISVEKKITIKLDGYRKTISEDQAIQLLEELTKELK